MSSTASTVKRVVAVLIAVGVVLAAGVIVGGAPTFFGVDEEPTASVAFEDQEGDGGNVTVEEVSTSDGGFVVIGDGTGTALAVSEYLEEGTHENVTVEAEGEETELVGQLTATVHRDTDDDEAYAYNETDGDEDRPYLEDGYPVSDTATVTVTDGEVALGDSFLVESVDAPATATANETIAVNATVSNPTGVAAQQHVEFRLDGTVTERQLVEIEASETRNVTFQVDTSTVEPGTHSIGVFTVEDGELAEIEVEFDGTPELAVLDGNESAITTSATLPAEGFVAVERAGDGNETERERIGTSEGLDVGGHEGVVVELDEPVADDEELVAVLYEGDADDPEGASVVETDDGEPVEVAFTLAGLDEGSEGDGSVDEEAASESE